jgi:tripartite-type tricarboxylate transporter receptor subunit TctC
MTNRKFPHRRQFLHLAAGAAALPALPHIARAQAYPTKPVRIVVPFAAKAATSFSHPLVDSLRPPRLSAAAGASAHAAAKQKASGGN